MSELEIDTPTSVALGPSSMNTDLSMPVFDRFVYTTIPLNSTHFSLGVQHVLSVIDNRLYACGSNDEKQLGIEGGSGPFMQLVTEFTVDIEVKVVRIGSSDTCSFVLMDDYTVWGFGTLRVCFISLMNV
jgi:alpha-tubulin suppressor-like RCC1 family protein